MANLKKTHHQLEKAQKKLEKYSKSQKQFQLEFVRKRRKNGKYRTSANIVRREKNDKYSNRGLVHKLVNQGSRIKGDKPSITKTLDSLKPKTFKGKFLKRSAQIVNFMAHDVGQTAVDTALASETIGLKSADLAKCEIIRKMKNKYQQEAVDDYHRGTIATLGVTKDAAKGTFLHFKQKNIYKLERAKYKVKKAEYRIFRDEQYKPKLARTRKELKKNRPKSKADKKQFRFKNKRLKNDVKKLKTEKHFMLKNGQKQWRIADLSRPAPLALKPVGYTGKRLSASTYQKAVNAEENNDFLRVVDEVKRHGVDRAISSMNPQKLKAKNQKKQRKFAEKKSNRQKKLQYQDYKLKKRECLEKHRKKTITKQNFSFSERLKNAVNSAFKFVKNVFSKEARNVLIACLVPILILLLIFAFILMIFSSILGGSGFILGTYTAQDYDLSEAEKYYTKLAYDLNEKIRKVGDYDHWRDGLAEFGTNKKSLKDTPDNWYWGQSFVYDWLPEYDFDVYRLWSFLCAYYYDFSAKNGDITYWKFGSDTENLLDEIFDAEYEFVYWYDNTSGWEYKYQFDSRGYYSIEGSGVSGNYGYINVSSPDALPFQGCNNENTIYFDLGNGEILNCNDDYSATGWYLKNQFIDDYDNSGTKYGAWYANGEQCSYGIWEDDVLVTPMPYVITENNWCSFLQKYDWKTDCRLYYNVKQKKSFENILMDKLKSQPHADERLEYYNLLVGNEGSQMYGNHQTLRNMLSVDTVRNYGVKQAFGYDMTVWNTASDGLYQGVKIYCSLGEKLYAPLACEIKDIDIENHRITLKMDNVRYWYDGSGGTKRDTEVTISNAVLLDGFSKGDRLKERQKFAETSAENVNFHINIDTDGMGWDYIDPRLVLY